MSETVAAREWHPMHSPYGRYVPTHMSHRHIWIQRHEWSEPQKVSPLAMDRGMNAIGLYWTPVLDLDEPAPHLPSPSPYDPA